jgi:uncharacterized protein (UPF0335 family)
MADDGVPSNGYPKGKVKDYVSRWENVQEDIQTAHMAYMTKVGRLKEDQADILEEAKSNGIPRRALKKVLKTRELQRKVEAIREDLEGDEVDQYDLLRHALGDLDDDTVKEAALARAKKRAEEQAPVDELGKGAKPH